MVKERKTGTSPWYKIKSEDGEEGWIHGDFIQKPDWNSGPCRDNEIGYISGGNLRSSPNHSVNEENILAIWDKGTKVRVLATTRGEPEAQTGSPFWYKVRILKGRCSFDSRNASLKDHSCESETEGYMHSNLFDCD